MELRLHFQRMGVRERLHVLMVVALVFLARTSAGAGPLAGPNGLVYGLAFQTDGKLVVAGEFAAIGSSARSRIGRLDADGGLDVDFNPGATGRLVNPVAVLPDGKILVGGLYRGLAGESRNFIGRLTPNGTLDSSFLPWCDNEVTAFGVEADGKVLVGGWFTTLGEPTHDSVGLARLNPDGTSDETFNPRANGSVVTLAVQGDGKILVGGAFTELGGETRSFIGRLNGDGSLDADFDAGANDSVTCIAIQSDGKILVGGRFTLLAGQERHFVGRLNADGSLDSNFTPDADGPPYSMVVQADGKILVGGFFTTLGPGTGSYLTRLNPDGTADPTLNPAADDYVLSLALGADGRIFVGGYLNSLGGQPPVYLGIISNSSPAVQRLTYDGSALTWTRDGTVPEIAGAAFEYSVDGYSWTGLGSGTRIFTSGGQSNGWQLTGLALPTNVAFRARGYALGGYGNGSTWPVETVLRPALKISQPSCCTQGVFQFSILGSTGQIVVIEVSPDLAAWTPVQTNTLPAAPLHFADPANSSGSRRFYRLRCVP